MRGGCYREMCGMRRCDCKLCWSRIEFDLRNTKMTCEAVVIASGLRNWMMGDLEARQQNGRYFDRRG